MAFELLKIPFSARARSAKFSDSCLCGLHGAAAPSSTKRCARAPLGRSRAPSRSARTPRGAARAAYGSLMRAGKPARAPRYCRALWRKRCPRGRAAVFEPDRRRAAPDPTRGRRRRLWARRTRRRPRARPRHRRGARARGTRLVISRRPGRGGRCSRVRCRGRRRRRWSRRPWSSRRSRTGRRWACRRRST